MADVINRNTGGTLVASTAPSKKQFAAAPAVSTEDGARAVAVAAQQSLREHRPVELREVGF